MFNSIVDLLLRDPVLSRLGAPEKVPEKANLPETLVAKVTALKGEVAQLRFSGGSFSALLNAPAVPGETLFLKQSGVKEGRPHYRIMSRLKGSEELHQGAKAPGEPQLFSLMSLIPDQKSALAALVRFVPEGAKGAGHMGPKEPLLELFLDTENLGLVLVQFYYLQKDRFACQFVVESVDSGRALQKEAENLVKEAARDDNYETGEVLRWSVGNLKRAVSEALLQEGYSLDIKA